MSDGNLNKEKTLLWLPAVLAATALVLFLDYRLFSAFVPSRKIPVTAEYDFGPMAEAWNTIHKVYVDRSALKKRSLTYGAIGGMVDALGDTGHSVFLAPKMIREERKSVRRVLTWRIKAISGFSTWQVLSPEG